VTIKRLILSLHLCSACWPLSRQGGITAFTATPTATGSVRRSMPGLFQEVQRLSAMTGPEASARITVVHVRIMAG
jgi:hypothetical protein